jgi:serine/threonine protein kinase
LLDGRYRVEATLGEGGMGYVVRARHVDLDQQVAVKLMREDVAPQWARRFMREARAASRIDSEHVARVFDVSRLEDGTPYMVMELLEGRDLGAVLESDGPITPELAVLYTRQTCRALSAAHALGIVHRDVKPENLFLTHDHDGRPCVKLLDFGVSKEMAAASAMPTSLTATHAVLGSPQFMSPEQLVSCRDVDHRADLWSLGATLFELVTLNHAFPADTLAELYTKILRDPAASLYVAAPHAPARLEQVVQRCLAKDPEERFGSADELEAALAAVEDDALAVRDTIEVPASLDRLDQTPIASVRPVVHPTLAPPAAKRRPIMGMTLLAALFAVVFVASVVVPQQPLLALSPAAPVVLAPAALTVTLPAPPPTSSAKDPSRFMDSVPLPSEVRAQLEDSLTRSIEELDDGELESAARRAQHVLNVLSSRGIRPNEAVSSVGAQAALLLGHVEADQLRAMIDAPASNQHDGEQLLLKLDRQMGLVRAAYARVRNWSVLSFYRCAVVETAALDLTMGRRFADGVNDAQWGNRGWFIKAASARLRSARLEFRHALDMRTETMLCVEEARQGHLDAKQALSTLPKPAR